MRLTRTRPCEPHRIMIPAHITKADVDEAIRRIVRYGVPSDRSSRRYCVVTNRVHLPPKYVISLAHRVTAGSELDSRSFSGGRESNEFLRRRGFEVIECDCGGNVGQPTLRIGFPTVPTVPPADPVDSLRWYVASRLVIEGGFDPDWIRPRPPIAVERDLEGLLLTFDPDLATADRPTLPGALKAARPDVAVTIPAIGPVLALSLEVTESVAVSHDRVPEMTGALEPIAGAGVNLHMMYPALVYGFWHILGDPGDRAARNGELAAEMRRYHDALARISGREGIRDDPSRYEACALTLVEFGARFRERIPNRDYPPLGSLQDYNQMFQRLYAIYDRRFVDSTRALRPTTERRVWHGDSPLLAETTILRDLLADVEPRVAG